MHPTSAMVLFAICSTAAAQGVSTLPPGVIPIPDPVAAPIAPAALTAAPAQTLAAATPAATTAAEFASAAFPAAATPAAAMADPAAAVTPGVTAMPAAMPAATALPTPAVAAMPATTPMTQFGTPMTAAGLPATAVSVPAATQYGLPAATAAFPAAAMPAALPATTMAGTGETVISVPPINGAAAAAADPLTALAGPTLPAGILPAGINQMVPSPPPSARPAGPPAPPIPRGADWKPQWDEDKDFSTSDVVVSFNVANTMEQVYWNQRKVREALAKSAGVLPNAVSYFQVLPSTDQFSNPFTTVRFVIQNRNAALAENLMTSLNDEKVQGNLKNRIEELELDLIGDSMNAQTPSDFKAAAKGATGPVATAGVDAGPVAGVGPASPGAEPLPGTAAAAAAAGGVGAANSTAGLPGAPGGMASTLAERRRQAASSAGAVSAAAAVATPLLMAVGALLL